MIHFSELLSAQHPSGIFPQPGREGAPPRVAGHVPTTQQNSFHPISTMTTTITGAVEAYAQRGDLFLPTGLIPFPGTHPRVPGERRKPRVPSYEQRTVRELFTSEVRETITAQAEQEAKIAGVYGSLKMAKQAVYEIMPHVRGITIDLVKDPEAEEHYTTICFEITVSESVEQMLELDEALRRTLVDRLPARDRPHFSLIYNFC